MKNNYSIFMIESSVILKDVCRLHLKLPDIPRRYEKKNGDLYEPCRILKFPYMYILIYVHSFSNGLINIKNAKCRHIFLYVFYELEI